jgi:peptidoglycan/LPS O-acetylase OafA/YrhL
MVTFGALVFLFGISPALSHRFAGYYRMPFGYTLDNAAICYLLFYFVRNPLSIGGRILNWRPIVHIGALSYSLHLWQQLFLGPGITHPLIGIFCAFACSEVSWHIVERPSLKLRDLTTGECRSPVPNAADSASLG